MTAVIWLLREMGKKTYPGGHTVIGPRSGWFADRRSLEDRATERAESQAEAWRLRVSGLMSQNEKFLTELEAKQVQAEKAQAVKKANAASKKRAREKRKQQSQALRRSDKVLCKLRNANPNLVRDIEELFGASDS